MYLILYLRSLGDKKYLNLTTRHIHQGHLDSGSRAGRETRSFSPPLQRCRPPLPALLASALASGPPTRGEPRLRHRALAGELRRPNAPAGAGGAAPALQLGPTLGAEDRHPEEKREDPTKEG